MLADVFARKSTFLTGFVLLEQIPGTIRSEIGLLSVGKAKAYLTEVDSDLLL